MTFYGFTLTTITLFSKITLRARKLVKNSNTSQDTFKQTVGSLKRDNSLKDKSIKLNCRFNHPQLNRLVRKSLHLKILYQGRVTK